MSASRRRGNEPSLEPLLGHDRFQAASQVLIGGVLASDPPADAGGVMKEHLELAKLPYARLQFGDDTLVADITELRRWWSQIIGAAEASA